MTTKRIIILIGLPGSGKGTHGSILSTKLNIPHISTGDIFRSMTNSDCEDSKLLRESMSKGDLVPSNLVNNIVKKYILSEQCERGCILDGYPRNIEQAEYFLTNINATIFTIYFKISHGIATKRTLGRYSCAHCGKLYNKYFNNTKLENKCDNCDSLEFDVRDDDEIEAIKHRIDEYVEKTLPLVDFFQSKGNFFAVEADSTIEYISEELDNILKKI
jgi:adenylate kinase